MAIPNVKRYRITNPADGDVATIMAVLPKEADVNAYLTDAAAAVRLEGLERSEGQRRQSPRRSAEAEEGQVSAVFDRALFKRSVFNRALFEGAVLID